MEVIIVGFFIVAIIIAVAKQARKNLDAQFEKIKLIIGHHAQELAIRRNQLTVRLNYGVTDDKKWQQEIGHFIDKVIAPQIGGHDALRKHYDKIYAAIDEATAHAHLMRRPFEKGMTPLDYEQLVADILTDLGWKTRLTKASGDQGIDVIAEANNVKVVVQCKLHKSAVGNAAVQEAMAGMVFERADYAAVVSNSSFTKSARQLATSAGVFLLHHDQLDDLKSHCLGTLDQAKLIM